MQRWRSLIRYQCPQILHGIIRCTISRSLTRIPASSPSAGRGCLSNTDRSPRCELQVMHAGQAMPIHSINQRSPPITTSVHLPNLPRYCCYSAVFTMPMHVIRYTKLKFSRGYRPSKWYLAHYRLGREKHSPPRPSHVAGPYINHNTVNSHTRCKMSHDSRSSPWKSQPTKKTHDHDTFTQAARCLRQNRPRPPRGPWRPSCPSPADGR